MKVLVGMSGGVDSSVTAHLLKEQGYEVEGVSLMLYEARAAADPTKCCSLQAIEDAAKTAGCIGIPHRAVDTRIEFVEKVIEPFIAAYSKGITPNPCILCNTHIKFRFLLNEADRRGADFIATGHYARTKPGWELEARHSGLKNSNSILLKGIDPKKDQSYVLYILKQEELNRLLLPLGDYRKEDVRILARQLNLPAASRLESQEICFIEDKKYFNFIDKVLPVESQPGPIIDIKNKKELGLHKGIHKYTIGQRKGLGISSPEPYYVVKIDPVDNTLYVGSQEDARCREFLVEGINWLIPQDKYFRAGVKVRSMMRDEPAEVSVMENGLAHIVYDDPQWAPAPGQSAVFYAGDAVIGGGVIKELKKNLTS